MITLAKNAALKAGQRLREMYRTPYQVRIKGVRDIVTEADLAAEAIIMEEILQHCPGAHFVSEESHSHAVASEDGPTWYIDPLDGTTNFSRGLPTFSVSIAMAERGQVVCAVVYDPLHEHLFYAERGGGAFLNGQPLRVSHVADLAEAILLLDWPRDQAMRQKSLQALARLAPRTDAVRSTGSAALSFCYVAAGWADLYFQYTLSPWDVAAGALIVLEAGGQVTGLDGRPATLEQPDWLVTNGSLHRAVLDLALFSH